MVIILVVFSTNRKDYEPFLADVVFAFDELGNLGIISHGLTQFFRVLDFRYPPAGGLRLLISKHTRILTHFRTKVKKKLPKSTFFWLDSAE